VKTSDESFEQLLEYLKRSRGFDFTAYKRPSLQRRVQRRMQVVGIDGFDGYGDYLEAHPQEITELFNTILINVTGFFRDSGAWEFLAADIIPRIVHTDNGDPSIRVWSAGCSSGEEAYTLAMLLAEAMNPEELRERVRIYATDVDEEALAHARLATYPEARLADVPTPLVEKYFERVNGQYVFNRDLRRLLIFGRHDLLVDPPISKVSLVVCRNTLMYFNSEAQQRLLERFHFALRDGGFLFLGKAEMLPARSNAFTPVDLKKRIFVKVVEPHRRTGTAAAGVPRLDAPVEPATAERLRDLSLQMDPTAQIVIDPGMNLIVANERFRTLFGVTEPDIGRPLQDLQISYRPVELRSLIDEAWRERRLVQVREVQWSTPSGSQMHFDVQIVPFFDSSMQVLGAKVLFRDETRAWQLESDLQYSRQELETANEELQSTNEELESTNEELQSTVEELETTNEELQSTNEELETMNEELQSTNDQLRQNGDELNRANAFLENILATVDQGIIVVDSELRVHAWNSHAEELWGLRHAEVMGRSFMSLDIGLPVDQLRVPLRRCLAGESNHAELTVTARNRTGRTIDLAVSCSPFRIGDNRTWGAIVMMQEKTEVPMPPAS
jgi:two-component system CheB/CheR fusion protein